jgi:hypothetical protein
MSIKERVMIALCKYQKWKEQDKDSNHRKFYIFIFSEETRVYVSYSKVNG